MRDYNTEPVYMQVYSSKIFSDPAYQRPVDARRVRQIVEEFNPAVVSPIKVSERDGVYWVFDGQHTLEALKKRNGGNDLFVYCAVFYGLTREDEAFLFSMQTGISRGVKANLKLRALYLSGDETVVGLKRTIENLGIRFDFTAYQGPCKIVACATAYKIYMSLGQKDFEDMLKVILQSWEDEPDRLSKEMLNGMYYFFITYKSEFDMKKAISQFSKVPLRTVVMKAKGAVFGGDKRFSRELVRVYNYGLRNRLDEYRLGI